VCQVQDLCGASRHLGRSGAAPVVIAIDGPGASGKGTLARALATRYGLAFLDTGALYRKTAWLVLHEGGNPEDPVAAARAAEGAVNADIPDAALRTAAVGTAASQVAAIPKVRAALLEAQRAFAHTPPPLADGRPARGAILDGRDIGTVVCPDARLKLFVTATPEVRAERRYRELRQRGEAATYDHVLADVRVRDARDANRDAAPMKPAPGAHLLDTSDLSIEAALDAAAALVERAMGA